MPNTHKMSHERTATLLEQWKELEPDFLKAKTALMSAKDRDDMYSLLIAEDRLDEAIDQAEDYSYAMTEAKLHFKSVRMIIETISLEDANHPIVKEIMSAWNPYKETYKKLARNYCSAYTFRKKKLREVELEDQAREAENNIRIKQLEAEARRKEKIALEEIRSQSTLAIKKLEVSQAASGTSSGTSTPAPSVSPVPPAANVLSKQDVAQFKPTNSLSSELSFIEMQDWKEEVLNWFQIAKHTDLQISMQKHLLKTVVDQDLWLKASYIFEAGDSHIVMVDKLVSQFEVSLPLFNRRQQFFDTKRGKNESLHSYMIKMERQGLSSKIQDMNLHKYLCHKFMTDEGPAFRKKVCGLKTPTGETNVNPTFKELLNLAALDYRESIMVADGKNKVNQTGAIPKREKVKKKENFIKCYCCGANGHKSSTCTVEKANLSCTFCSNTGSHNTQACRKKEAGEKSKKSPESSPHRARSQSPTGGRRSQTPAAALSTNSATVRHNLNRVNITYHKDVKNMSYTVNNTVKSSGNLRKLIAKLSALRIRRKTFKETITLDSGASCSLLRLNIAQKLNLNLRPAPGVTITGAGGESLEVAGQTDVFFSIFDNKPVRLHMFVSPDLHEDVLISADHLEALALLPPKWPHCLNPKHKDYSANYTANSLKQEKAEEQRDQATESEEEEEEDPDTIPVRIPRTRVNLDEELWQDTGEVHDIPKLDTFPEETRQILLKYGDVFKSSLSKARKMKTEPIKLEIDPDIPKPHPATKCRSMPLHWQESLDELLDSLIAEGVIVPQEGATDFVAPSFLVAKPHDPSRGRLVQDYSDGVKQLSQEVSPPNSQPIPSLAEGPPSLYLLFFG